MWKSFFGALHRYDFSDNQQRRLGEAKNNMKKTLIVKIPFIKQWFCFKPLCILNEEEIRAIQFVDGEEDG